MKLINIHDVEVSISAWVSHVMLLKIESRKLQINLESDKYLNSPVKGNTSEIL